MSFWTEWPVWVIGAGGTVLIAWLNGFLNQFLPAPERAKARTRKPDAEQDATHLKIGSALCCAGCKNDPKGDGTGNVAQAFTNIEGVALFRSARVVAAAGGGHEWRVAMEREARSVLDAWGRRCGQSSAWSSSPERH